MKLLYLCLLQLVSASTGPSTSPGTDITAPSGESGVPGSGSDSYSDPGLASPSTSGSDPGLASDLASGSAANLTSTTLGFDDLLNIKMVLLRRTWPNSFNGIISSRSVVGPSSNARDFHYIEVALWDISTRNVIHTRTIDNSGNPSRWTPDEAHLIPQGVTIPLDQLWRWGIDGRMKLEEAISIVNAYQGPESGRHLWSSVSKGKSRKIPGGSSNQVFFYFQSDPPGRSELIVGTEDRRVYVRYYDGEVPVSR